MANYLYRALGVTLNVVGLFYVICNAGFKIKHCRAETVDRPVSVVSRALDIVLILMKVLRM